MTQPASNAESKDDNRASSRETKEQKLERLLAAAAGLMAKRGYSQTTIRDVARETGFSLAGMYYYFESKEDLLYQIQWGTFSRLLVEQEARLAEGGSARDRLRRLVSGHLSFFHRHSGEMKVCTFELESLTGEAYDAVEIIRRRYYRLVAEVVADLVDQSAGADPVSPQVRHLTLFVFGAMNWVFMWYQPDKDVPIEDLAVEMTDFVLNGLDAKLSESST